MNKYSKLVLPLMFATSLATAPAVMAQGMEAPAQVPSTGMAPGTEMPGMDMPPMQGTPDSPTAGSAQAPTGAAQPGAGVSGPVDLGAAMTQIPQEKDKIQQVQQVAAVQVINVTGALQGGNEEALDQLISSNKTQIEELQTAIEGKPEMAQALQSQNVQVASVFAAQVNPDNSVTVFTR